MDKDAIATICLAMPGVEEDFKEEWKAWRYRAGEKMFALIGDYQERQIVSLKCDPLRALELRDMYSDIFPGYYLNKSLWNSVYLDGEVPERLIQSMVQDSYQLIFSSLTKKLQRELLAGTKLGVDRG